MVPAFRRALAIALLAGCRARLEEPEPEAEEPSCLGPPTFSTPTIAARALATTVPSSGETLILTNSDESGTAGRGLRALCVQPDLSVGAEAPLGYEGTVNAVAGAARDEGGFDVVLAVTPAEPAGATALLSTSFDCASGWSALETVAEAPMAIYIGSVARVSGVLALTLRIGDEDLLGLVSSEGFRSVVLEVGGHAVASNGEVFAVATNGQAGPSIGFYDTAGASIGGPVPLPGEAYYVAPSMCWDGEAWGVAYTRRTEDAAEVQLARVGADGSFLVAPVRLSSGDGGSSTPRIACTPQGYAVAWQANTAALVPGTDLAVSSIRFAEIDLAGTATFGPVDLEPPLDRLAMLPTVATGERATVAWTTYGDGGYDARVMSGDRCPRTGDSAR